MTSKITLAAIVAAMFAGVEIMPVIVLTILVIADVITGIISAVVIGGKESFSSSIGLKGLMKKLMLVSIPVLIAFLGNAAEMDVSFLVKGTIFSIGLYELSSIIGNIISANKGEPVPELIAISELYEQLRVKFRTLAGLEN